MAIPTFKGITNGQLASGALTVASNPWVAGHAIGDIGVAVCTSSVLASPGSHTLPSGFSGSPGNPSDWSTAASSSAVKAESAYKRAVSTTEAAAAFGTDIGAQYQRHLLFGGCKTSGDPFNVGGSGIIASAATNQTVTTGLTTTVNDSLIVLAFAQDYPLSSTTFLSAFANSNLANLTQRGGQQFSTNNGIGLYVITGELATAGDVGSFSLTFLNAGTVAWWCGALESADPSGGITFKTSFFNLF